MTLMCRFRNYVFNFVVVCRLLNLMCDIFIFILQIFNFNKGPMSSDFLKILVGDIDDNSTGT